MLFFQACVRTGLDFFFSIAILLTCQGKSRTKDDAGTNILQDCTLQLNADLTSIFSTFSFECIFFYFKDCLRISDNFIALLVENALSRT